MITNIEYKEFFENLTDEQRLILWNISIECEEDNSLIPLRIWLYKPTISEK